jgi:uncharacterized protein with HEPN domain
MPPSVEDRLQDILASIEEIEDVLQGAGFDQFSANRRMRLLIERLLEIVCEAARRLPEHIKLEEPAIEWREMSDFANRLGHAYHTTDVKIVWDIIENHLPTLKSVAQRRIREAGK